MNLAELKGRGLSPTAKLVWFAIKSGVSSRPSVLVKELELPRTTVWRALKELNMFQNETPMFQNETPMFQNETDVSNRNTNDEKPAECFKMKHPDNENFSGAYNVFNKALKDNINTKKQNITKELSTADGVIVSKKVTYEDLKDYVFRNNINIISSHIVGFEEKNSKEQKPVTKKIKESTEMALRVINYLNDKLGCRYKPSSSLTKELVSARVGEGFVYEDFVSVIDNMAEEWLYDEKMKKFLRPETLFSRKFEGYLNQSRLPKPRVRGSPKTQGNWVLLEERLKKYEEEEEAERSEQERQEAV